MGDDLLFGNFSVMDLFLFFFCLLNVSGMWFELLFLLRLVDVRKLNFL